MCFINLHYFSHALATFHPSKFGAANLPGAPNTCPQTDPNVVFWRGASATGNFEVWHLQHEILLLMNAHMVIWEIWKMAEYIRIKICNTRPTVWIGLVQSLQSSSVSSTFRHCQATSTQILAMTASKTGMTRYDRCQCLHASAETYPTSPDLPHPLLSGSMCTLHHLAPPCTTLHPTRLPEVRGPGKQTFLAALLLHGVLRCFISFKWLLPTTPKLAVCSFTTLQCRHKSPGKHLNPWRPPAPSDSCQSSVNPGPWPAACGVHSWAPYLAWRRKWSFYTELLKEYHVVT